MAAHDTETVYQTQLGWEPCVLAVEFTTIVEGMPIGRWP